MTHTGPKILFPIDLNENDGDNHCKFDPFGLITLGLQLTTIFIVDLLYSYETDDYSDYKLQNYTMPLI